MTIEFQAGVLTALSILRSDEGRQLRSHHQENVKYLRNKLFEAGIAAEPSPSHIITITVSS